MTGAALSKPGTHSPTEFAEDYQLEKAVEVSFLHSAGGGGHFLSKFCLFCLHWKFQLNPFSNCLSTWADETNILPHTNPNTLQGSKTSAADRRKVFPGWDSIVWMIEISLDGLKPVNQLETV